MSACYISVKTTWPTTVSGRRDTSEQAQAVLTERIAALTDEVLEQCADTYAGDSLAGLGMDPMERYFEARSEPADEESIEAGRVIIRGQLKEIVSRSADLEEEVDLTFDGVRWWALTGGMSNGDAPNEMYGQLRLLDTAGICAAPTDGPEFRDTAALIAAIAVVDDLVAKARAALGAADLTEQQSAAVDAALEAGRQDLFGVAATLRRAFTIAAPD